MANFTSINALYNNVKSELDSINDKNSATIIFSFNGTGKTRLSNEFYNLNDTEDRLKVLCYNSFFEDYFNWDNEKYTIVLNHSWIQNLLINEGLENQIIKNFKNILNTKLEPSFSQDMSEIYFNIPTGDDSSLENIKISRGEESTFIWIVFYSILELAIESLNVNVEDRSTDIFNNLEYIVIDDPVSSLDDTRLITLAVSLIGLIREYKGTCLKLLITTHHALFYNIFYSSLRFNALNRNTKILTKEDFKYKLEKSKDSPFSYHHVVIKKIQRAINTNNIEKYHFNLFRALLEKTSSFLGLDKFEDCIKGAKKDEIIRLLHSYSHNKLSEIEFKDLSSDNKELFKLAFNEFIKEFKWGVK